MSKRLLLSLAISCFLASGIVVNIYAAVNHTFGEFDRTVTLKSDATDEDVKNISSPETVDNLIMSGCVNITDKYVTFDRFSNLSYIDVSKCTQFTGVNLPDFVKDPDKQKLGDAIVTDSGVTEDVIKILEDAGVIVIN